MKRMKQKGFTIIELVVVIAIISVLASIILVNVVQYNQRGKAAWVLGQVNQIQKALEMYKNQYGYYPYQNGKDLGYPDGIDAAGCTDPKTEFDNSFVGALTLKLVPNFIAQIKDYTTGENPTCGGEIDESNYTFNSFFEYQTKDSEFTCGGEVMNSTNAPYYILIGSPFPIPNLKSVGSDGITLKYYYCISSPK